MPWIDVGSYVGDNVDGRAITGIGFSPDVVFIRSEYTISAQAFLTFKSTTMAATAARSVDSTFDAMRTDQITSLDADGFTIIDAVSADYSVNRLNEIYHYMAFQNEAGLFSHGTYTGDGGASKAITGLGFAPVWVIVGSEQIEKPWISFKTLGSPDPSGHLWDDPGSNTSILSLDANGFTVQGAANDLDAPYHWVAFGTGADIVMATYSGNGADNHAITGVGFEPVMVWIHEIGGATTYFKPDTITGELTLWGNAGANLATGGIKTLDADGFTLGTWNEVNQSGFDFRYLAFRGAAAVVGGSWQPNWQIDGRWTPFGE